MEMSLCNAVLLSKTLATCVQKSPNCPGRGPEHRVQDGVEETNQEQRTHPAEHVPEQRQGLTPCPWPFHQEIPQDPQVQPDTGQRDRDR